MGVCILALGNYTVHAQDNAPEYVGAEECASCHRSLAREHADSSHALALQDVSRSRDKDNILGDFDQGEDVRQVQLPGEDAPRAFTADDIAYAVGSGVHVQRYLYEVDRNDYMVLPAEWNVAEQKWEPYTLADEWPSQAYDWEDNCAYCHTGGFDVDRGRWVDDGVQCEDCHGPASNHVDAAQDAGRNPSDEELVAIRSAIYRSADPQVCGACHSRGESPDGHPYPVGYTPGATLSDFYQLVPNDSADHWWLSGHASQPNMQYNEWLTSAHASSAADIQKSSYAADVCLACHSQDARQVAALIEQVEAGDREGAALDPVTVSGAQWGVTCTTCHSQHADTDQPFNLVDEANQLCVSCHTNPQDITGIHHPVMEMFEGVSLVTGIEGVPGKHFSMEDGPRCVTCHMQQSPVGDGTRAAHGFTPVLPGESEELPSACAGCHTDLTTTDLAFLVKDTQDTVRARLAAALSRLGDVPKPDEGSEASARYEQVVAALNFVQNDGSLGMHNYAYADALLTAAEQDLSLLSVAGASVSPTEAPAPTATPPGGTVIVRSSVESDVVPSGVRPVTLIVIALVVGILLFAAFAFFRKRGA
ncbi:MAG: cytochrome c3 family protein [Anaerolineae bacterium]